MATKKTETTKKAPDVNQQVKELRSKLLEVKLNIQAGLEKNTNAAAPIKKQIAQLLTKVNSNLQTN